MLSWFISKPFSGFDVESQAVLHGARSCIVLSRHLPSQAANQKQKPSFWLDIILSLILVSYFDLSSFLFLSLILKADCAACPLARGTAVPMRCYSYCRKHWSLWNGQRVKWRKNSDRGAERDQLLEMEKASIKIFICSVFIYPPRFSRDWVLLIGSLWLTAIAAMYLFLLCSMSVGMKRSLSLKTLKMAELTHQCLAVLGLCWRGHVIGQLIL